MKTSIGAKKPEGVKSFHSIGKDPVSDISQLLSHRYSYVPHMCSHQIRSLWESPVLYPLNHTVDRPTRSVAPFNDFAELVLHSNGFSMLIDESSCCDKGHCFQGLELLVAGLEAHLDD